MISTKSLIILFCIFSISILPANFSEATIDAQGYNFGNIEVGSTQTTFVRISNAETMSVNLTWISFAQNSCKDFLIKTALPKSIPLQPNESVNVEIGYSPTIVGECSDTLRIYTDGSPMWSKQVTFSGVGVEQAPEQPAPENISQLLLEKLKKIIDYINESYTYQAFRSYEQDRLSEGRLNAFKTKLVVSYHLIEKGQFEAAHNKLKEIYKKTNGKPESNDFVSPEKAAHLTVMLQELISSFDFEDKPAKQSKKSI